MHRLTFVLVLVAALSPTVLGSSQSSAKPFTVVSKSAILTGFAQINGETPVSASDSFQSPTDISVYAGANNAPLASPFLIVSDSSLTETNDPDPNADQIFSHSVQNIYRSGAAPHPGGSMHATGAISYTLQLTTNSVQAFVLSVDNSEGRPEFFSNSSEIRLINQTSGATIFDYIDENDPNGPASLTFTGTVGDMFLLTINTDMRLTVPENAELPPGFDEISTNSTFFAAFQDGPFVPPDDPTAVSEPATFAVFGFALAGLAYARRRRNR